jgi:hypothetical protein
MIPLSVILGISNAACALLIIGLALPLLRRRVGMNSLYGVRFGRSFESEELWYDINEFGARRLIRWSIVLLMVGIATFFVPLGGRSWLTLGFAMAPLLLVIPCIETYRYARGL